MICKLYKEHFIFVTNLNSMESLRRRIKQNSMKCLEDKHLTSEIGNKKLINCQKVHGRSGGCQNMIRKERKRTRKRARKDRKIRKRKKKEERIKRKKKIKNDKMRVDEILLNILDYL